MRFLNNLSLEGNQLLNFVVQNLATEYPTSLHKPGRLYFYGTITDLTYAPVERLMYNTDGGSNPVNYAKIAVLEDLDELERRIAQNVRLPLGQLFVGDANDKPKATAKSDIPWQGFGRTTIETPGDQNSDWLINKVATPKLANDAANKAYVDASRTGLLTKPAVDMATTGLLPAHTVNAPTGVGGSMTATANGVLVVDGIPVIVDDRILVKDETKGLGTQAGAAMNGIYKVTAAGSAYAPWTMVRADDADASGDSSSVVSQGITCAVIAGSSQVGTQWVLFTPNPIVLNTTDQDWQLTFQQQDLVAGSGIVKTGNRLDLDLFPQTLSVLGIYGASEPLQLGIVKATAPGVVAQIDTQSGTYPSWLTSTITGHVVRISTLSTPTRQAATWGFLKATELDPTVTKYSVLANPVSTDGAVQYVGADPVPASGAARKFFVAGLPDPSLKFSLIAMDDLPVTFSAPTQYSVVGNPSAGTGDVTSIGAGTLPTTGVANTAMRKFLLAGPLPDPAVKFATFALRDLPDGVSTSVLGQSAATGGVYADIQATSDNRFLVRRSGTLSFGFMVWADLPSPLNTASNKYGVFGNPNGTDSHPAAWIQAPATPPTTGLTSTARRNFLLQGPTPDPAISWTTVALRDLPDALTTSVLGRATSTAGVYADIQAGGDNRFLVRRGGILSFGLLAAGDLVGIGARVYSETITGDGIWTFKTITHNFASPDVHVQVYAMSTTPYDLVGVDIERPNANLHPATPSNSVIVRFAEAPVLNVSYRVIVFG